MKTFNKWLVMVVVAVAGLLAPVTAQVSLSPTTLAAAVGQTDNSIVVASATGFAANYVVVIDGEVMTVQSTYVSGTRIPVTRGTNSTVARPHASGATVTVGPGNYFSFNAPPAGPCTSTNEVALPRIVFPTPGSTPPSVSIYDCKGATSTTQGWVQYTKDGYPMFGAAIGASGTGIPPTYTAAGALVVMPGVSYIGSNGALAMTLAAPSLYQNGMIMVIQASTAQAHTVTYTAGFYGNTTSSDVCTFGGAIGDNLIIYAVNGAWRVISTRNCTIA